MLAGIIIEIIVFGFALWGFQYVVVEVVMEHIAIQEDIVLWDGKRSLMWYNCHFGHHYVMAKNLTSKNHYSLKNGFVRSVETVGKVTYVTFYNGEVKEYKSEQLFALGKVW